MTYFTDPVGNALSVPVASSLIGFSSDLKKAYDAGTPEQQSILTLNAIRKNITSLKDLDNWMKFGGVDVMQGASDAIGTSNPEYTTSQGLAK